MQTQTTTAAMPTTTVLIAQYNAITAYNTQEGKDLARAIIQGDTSGKVPTKKEQIVMDDCEGEFFIPAILAVKAGKLSPQQAVAPLASRDTLRPAMNCVYYDSTRAAVVATCGHVLMSFPCGPLAPTSGLLHPVTLEPLKVGDVVNKQVMNKDSVDTRYPDHVNVIRLPNPNGPAVTLDVQSFRNQLAGIARAQRFVNLYTGIRARIQHEGQDFYVDAALCDNVLRAMQASGTTRVHLDLSYSSRALQFTDVNDAKKLALIMPVQGPEQTYYKQGFAYCTVLDTAVGQVLTNPAPVKRVTVKKPVQPRAVQVLSKDEKKSLAAHVKQYEEAPDSRQPGMLREVRESVAKNIANLRKVAFRDTVNGTGGTPLGTAHEYVTTALFLARVGRAFLTTIAPAPADQPHQIGQPITHAPTVAALAELVTLATAQMEREVLTSTVPNLTALEFCSTGATARCGCPVIHKANGRYIITATHPETNATTRCTIAGRDGFDTLRDLTKHAADAGLRVYAASPGKGEPTYLLCVNEKGTQMRNEAKAGPPKTSPTVPAEVPALLPARYYIWAGSGRYNIIDSMATRLQDGCVTRRGWDASPRGLELATAACCKLNASEGRQPLARREWPIPTPTSQDTTALLVEHQGDEYAAADNDEQPDELIRARHGEPAPVLTPKPMSKRKFLFSTLRLAGHRVVTLHQVGKCAVARVFPCEGRAPYYAARFRQHTVQFGHLHEAEQALLTLRRLDNAEIRRDNEVFTASDALDQLDLSPACLARFCDLHGLNLCNSYTRRELRRAITDRREPKMPVYLSLLNKLTVTNLATK